MIGQEGCCAGGRTGYAGKEGNYREYDCTYSEMCRPPLLLKG